ncbi:hypothetical protein Y032_0012g1826 [Ancylostoma ceylanicum]|uniref:PTHB1 N-terminal domain-containing protein n=1 Tax=Ancylostoma ceylanicum TaxID=53326 RepID=A0A016VCD6_9BILA|nr:hypothetical protein Y032_0012g1826 [Ancylostoma ceylanicum]
MSLFRISEWYTNLYPAASCITVGTLIEGRDQLIIGGEDGVVTVLDPGGAEKDPVLLEQQTGRPVIDIIIGEFLPAVGPVLAVLTPRVLSYFRLSYDASDLSRTKLEHMFSHEMPEHAYNMCTVPSPTTLQILVQSVGCVLTLYQGDQCVFSRSPLPALHPGPLSYCYPSSSLVTSNGGRLHSVKFSLLAGLGNTGKRVTVKETLSVRLCVATSSNTLLVFLDNKLMWNSQTEDTVVSLKLSTFNSTYQNVLSMLSTEGRVSIGYLGTEPNLYKVPVDNRFIDFKTKIQEMRDIEASIKDSGSVGLEKKSALTMKCTAGELEKSTIEHDAKQGAPICPVMVTLQGIEGADQVKINIRSTLHTTSKQFAVDHPEGTETVKIPFFVGDNMPTSTTVHLAAHCSGTQATAVTSFRVPFAVMFTETSPERNATHKLTLDSDQSCVPLNTLFHEFQTENPQSIGFRVHGYDATVSVFTAHKSSRYRIQTDHLQLLNVVVTELVERLRVAQHGVQLHANIPMGYITSKLEELIELESKGSIQEKVIGDRSREMRAIEALILSKTRNTKPETFEHIDLLYNEAHEQLFAAIAELTSIRAQKHEAQLTLASLFDLVSLLLRLGGSDSALDGNFITDTNQTLEDRLAWASQIANDPARAVAVLCQHTQKELPQIKEEEEEGDDFDHFETGDIKL